MLAFVTGADGLLGSHACRKLLAKGFEVRILKEPGSQSPTLDGLSIETVEADLLSNDKTALENAVKGADVVFHIAAITNMWAKRDITFKVNVDATRYLLDAAEKAGVGRFVFVGSASSYEFGTMENPGDETGGFPAAYRGVAYMESKFEAMNLVKQYVNDSRLDAVVVAPTFLLGNLDSRPSSGELIRQFVSKRMKVTSGGGRNFAYAPDVAELLLLAYEKGESGETYLGAGENLTYMDFFSRVAVLAGIDPPQKTIGDFTLKAIGHLAGLYGKLSGKPVALNATMARLATYKTYYSPKKAHEKLGMPLTNVDTAIQASLQSLYDFGHLTK